MSEDAGKKLHGVVNADCLDAMKRMPDNSVDAIVTDPPYGISFMSKGFDTFKKEGMTDNQAFQADMTPLFKEMLRVAKPGAHLLAFGGTRTYHRLTCAIEDAGWEIRDCLGWTYSSGMPKSMDISKAIDKVGGVDPSKSGDALMAARERAKMSREELAEKIGCTPASIRDWEEGRARSKGGSKEHVTPSKEYRNKLNEILGFTKDERVVLGIVEDKDRRGDGTVYGLGHSGTEYSNEPQTELAKKWSGWGTCLKPAFEPIVLARKPVEGTIAENVMKWGVGGLNIDECRVPSDKPVVIHSPKKKMIYDSGHKDLGTWMDNRGRFPANIIHDGSEEVLGVFPNNVKGGTWNRPKGARPFNNNGEPTDYTSAGSDASIGSAARFFYCPKASKKEKGKDNSHPTVKPIELMKYLVKLVAPRGALVLDPFMGSGSTGVAAIEIGRRFIGIEKEPEYFKIAERRLEQAKPESPDVV